MQVAVVLQMVGGQPSLPPRVFFVSLTEIEEDVMRDVMRGMIIGLSALAFTGLPALACANGEGAEAGQRGQ